MAPHTENRIRPCPPSPNCVSSLAGDVRHYVAPIRYEGDEAEMRHRILNAVNAMRGARVTVSDQKYIRAEFVSSVFQFIDDVEFEFDTAEKQVQVRSASRKGYYDLGVNRRRIERIRKKLNQSGT